MNDLGAGFGYLMKGQRWVFGHGRWFGFGLLPALVTLVVYAGALIGLAYGADDLVAWATPFADDWSSPWPGLLRGTLVVLVFLLGMFLAVVTFTAVTLLVGQPFYESLSEEVERGEGGEVPESDLPLWRELWISARDSVRILLRVAVYGVLLFALGFIPAVGQTVIPALGFCVSGYFLSEELTGVALQRRGMVLKDRLALLRRLPHDGPGLRRPARARLRRPLRRRVPDAGRRRRGHAAGPRARAPTGAGSGTVALVAVHPAQGLTERCSSTTSAPASAISSTPRR